MKNFMYKQKVTQVRANFADYEYMRLCLIKQVEKQIFRQIIFTMKI